MFLNIQIDWIILNTYDQQLTLTTKKSLHIIFKAKFHYITLSWSQTGPKLIADLQRAGI